MVAGGGVSTVRAKSMLAEHAAIGGTGAGCGCRPDAFDCDAAALAVCRHRDARGYCTREDEAQWQTP
jgi:hypothetical protein